MSYIEPEAFRVALGNRDETEQNTLVIADREVTLFLERDYDDDPLQDDRVRLLSFDGSVELILESDDPEHVEAVEDESLLCYRFLAVPFGLYRVMVEVDGGWKEVINNLIVRRQGVFIGDVELSDAAPSEVVVAVDRYDDDAADDQQGDEQAEAASEDGGDVDAVLDKLVVMDHEVFDDDSAEIAEAPRDSKAEASCEKADAAQAELERQMSKAEAAREEQSEV
jgi:hypothetical protein